MIWSKMILPEFTDVNRHQNYDFTPYQILRLLKKEDRKRLRNLGLYAGVNSDIRLIRDLISFSKLVA